MTCKVNLIILLVGAVILGSLIVPGASAAGTVTTTHPYMLFRDISKVPGYQNQAQDPWKTWQSQVITASNGYLSDNFAGNLGSYDRISYRAQFAEYLGLSYQITKNAAYAQKGKEALLNMSVGSTEATADDGLALEGYSLAYDWIQPSLDKATDMKIRDNLATLADKVYKDTTTNGKGYIDFPDLHGHLYPALGMASAALSDYTNPNKLALSSGPSDWYHFGTDYLFVNDLQHTYGNSLFAHASDPTGKDLLGAYKAYTVDDLSTWFQVCYNAYGINLMSTYPVAEKYFTSETWESLPNEYSNDFVTNGNTMWDTSKGVLSLMTPADQATVLNHIKLVEADKILPNSNYINGGTEGGISTDLLYCVYGNYNSVTPAPTAATSHMDSTGVLQIIRQNWNNDADWLSFTTWNNVADSNRNMIHNDQLGFEYYSRGDLLLADAGEPKHILDGNYGEEDIDHNVIAIDNPRTPFTLSPWSGSTSAGLHKGAADQLTTPATIGSMFQLPWMQLIQSNVTATTVESGAWGSTQALSSPIQYERDVLYPESDYFIIVDRLQGTESWGYRNIFRPSSLMVTSSTGTADPAIGHDNVALTIGSTPYNWQSLAYRAETNTGLTADSLTWTTTNPYGKAVTAKLVTSPSSSILVEKNDGRIGGYSPAAEVYTPVVYFKNAPATTDYRVTALLSSYSTETPKTGTELAVTGTGHALNVHAPSYDDYIYTGTGVSTFGTYTTDADTAYIRTSGGAVSDYTMLKGSYLNVGGAPVVSLSKKVDYFTAKRSGSTLSFQISGQTSADITINGVAVSSVTRDGSPYTSWVTQNNGTAVKITTELSTHQFVVTIGNSLSVNPISPVSVAPGTAITIPVNTTYTGKGTVTYSASGLPSGATFNAATHIFAWTPATTQIGTYTVTFSATDGTLSANTNAVITVGTAATNHAPVITAIPAKSVAPGTALSIVVNASDPDGNTLTYSASSLPSGASFNAGT
ncbi:MAG TPA: putative Ig domain-containing protein, partial [Methanoregula sp.]|nr:putative Ig domain-containing protein [Methanoregula sp.]